MPELLVGLKIALALNVEPVVLAFGGVAEVVACVDDLDRRVGAIQRGRRRRCR
ncbi:MAG TPA: hypothetical protein VFE35_03860 [Candidatus Cybelea sp.]|jgi:hypothetical protein|nr:hypothetical protein [Candidatus Cybelea sp.]